MREYIFNKNVENSNSVSVAAVSHISPTLVRPAVVNLSVNRQQGSLLKPAVCNLSVNRQLGSPFEQAASDLSVSRRQGSLHKPAVYNQAVIRQRGLTCKPVASGLSVSRQHGFSSVPGVPASHGRNEPRAVITRCVNSTAHTSAHSSGRGEMQCVETPSQPFRAGPPLGCFTSNSGKGSGMARHHDYHSTTRTGLPALGALLRVAADMFDGQMDEQADQQRVLSAICPPPPRSSMGFRKHSCHPKNSVLRSRQSCGNSC